MEATSKSVQAVAEEDLLRARFYGFLSRLLSAPPSAETLANVRALEGDETDLGRALNTLASVAAQTSVEEAEDEFNALFVGVGAGGELLPYASHYLTGFVYEKPLADLRASMAELGIEGERSTGEPEDHIATVLEIMHGLIGGTLGEAADLAAQRAFFNAHLAPWAPRFFEDLERAKAARLFMPIGAVGRVFMAIETEGFELAA